MAGAVGPLYYVTVSIASEPVEAMVDIGSSATILSFELFKPIGKKANIPVSALCATEVVLRTIISGLYLMEPKLNLSSHLMVRAWWPLCMYGVRWVLSLRHDCWEPMLLFHLTPAGGVEPRREQKATVRLVGAHWIPSQKGALVEAQIEGNVPRSTVLFEPSTKWCPSSGVELEDSLVCPYQEGKIFILIMNATADTLRALPEENISSVGLVEVKEDAVSESSHGGQGEAYVAKVISPVCDGKREKLADLLTKGEDPGSGVWQQVLECALGYFGT